MKVIKKIAVRALIALSVLIGILLILVFAVPMPERLLSPHSQVIRYENGIPAYVFLSDDDKWRMTINKTAIDPGYLEALIRYEDKRFYSHFGIDLLALGRAFFVNLSKGRVVSGASTITMQLVRMLEPRERTFFSKMIEAFRAVQLECRLSKDDILTAYLQYLPYGKNIEGIESAAYAYFGHSASALSKMEITYLLAVPQNPNRLYPAENNREKIKSAISYVSQRLFEMGGFTEDDLEKIKTSSPPDRLIPFPRDAEHCAFWLREKGRGKIDQTTTLKQDIQELAVNVLNSHRETLAHKGIHNGAVVVIDNLTSRVRALVGNFDFWDEQHGGQVNGFTALRSPGSTLKPFIYALTIDDALALPSQMMKDIPVHYGTYQPRNYDGSYNGLVSLEKALSDSLNIPFIHLTREIGLENFITFLKDAGVTSLKNEPGYYGLSIAAGGAELNLLELTTMYTLFSRNGSYKKYTIFADEEKKERSQLISAESAYLTREALMIRDRPDFIGHKDFVKLPPRILWKTGTSQGRKDAWAVGANGSYTIGVWVGNFDSTPSIHIEGAGAASPILFDLLSPLSNRSFQESTDLLPPDNLQLIDVCSFSGFIPGPHCEGTKKQKAPVDNLPVETCPYHQKYFIDNETGYHLPPTERFKRSYHEETYIIMPASVRRWIKGKNRIAKEPPAIHPDFQYAVTEDRPRIILPHHNSTYFLIPGMDPSKQELPLEAESFGRDGTLYWYINDEFFAESDSSQRQWFTPKPGEHKIRVINSSGQFDTITIKIALVR